MLIKNFLHREAYIFLLSKIKFGLARKKQVLLARLMIALLFIESLVTFVRSIADRLTT